MRSDPMNAKSAGANGARHRGKRDNWQGKDSTSVSLVHEANAGPGRKSASGGRQAAGQLRRAAECELLATRAERVGRWPDARRLRHEANELRRLARGSRVEGLVLDIARDVATARLVRWAGRGA